MSEETENKKTKWIVAGVLGVAVVGGGIALAMSGGPELATVDWYGFQIHIEPRNLDDEVSGGKPFRWVVSRDDQMLGTGLAESKELAIDAAKSAIEGLPKSPAAPLGGGLA